MFDNYYALTIKVLYEKSNCQKKNKKKARKKSERKSVGSLKPTVFMGDAIGMEK